MKNKRQINKNLNKSVDIEIEEQCSYVNLSKVELSMKKLSNVDNKLTIAAEITDEGCFVQIIVYVDDEQIAKKLAEDIDHINVDNCDYGILCQKKSVHIKSLNTPSSASPLVSEASHHYTSILAIMISFVLIMVN